MQKKCRVDIGYSDHSNSIEVPIVAVSLGAKIIEKHLTLDRNMIGPDHKASLNPSEFKKMIKNIRNTETILGSAVKRPTPSEIKNIVYVRKSIVALKKIKKGEKFSMSNITVKRPGNGISPSKFNKMIGNVSDRDYAKDELIKK